MALREYVWLGELPLAMVADSVAGAPTYWIHTDQLGTPQTLTDASATVVWDTTRGPFGEWLTITGAAVMPLRFPGQVFDADSGWHDNHHRSYDPNLGRYLQSDPIGLAGGLNPYDYVGGNPLGYADPSGQCPLCLVAAVLAVTALTPQSANAPGPGDSTEPEDPAAPIFNAMTVATMAPVGAIGKVLAKGGQCAAEAVAPALTKGGTYVLRNLAGDVMRVGRTNNLVRREAEHALDPILKDFRFNPIHRTDSYAEQRGLEQMLHDVYDPPLDKINPISPRNSNYDSYMGAANRYLDRTGE